LELKTGRIGTEKLEGMELKTGRIETEN